MRPGALTWVAVAAVAAALADPPFGLLIPSFVCLIPLVRLLERHRVGYLSGARLAVAGAAVAGATTLLSLDWLPGALWRFHPWAVAGVGVAVLGRGLIGGLALVATAWVRRRSDLPLWVVLPPFVVVIEWLPAHAGAWSVPWLGLGTSLAGFPFMVQVADLIGARGIAWLLALANVALAEAIRVGVRSPRGQRPLAVVVTGILLCLDYGAIRARDVRIRTVGTVGIVQPNVGYRDKWDLDRQDSVVRAMAAATGRLTAAGGVDLVVWPEMALPGAINEHPGWGSMIRQRVAASRVSILTGTMIDTAEGGHHRYFNAALLFAPEGPAGRLVYRKRFLVPFLERDPRGATASQAAGGFGGYAAGRTGAAEPTALGRIAVSICFEGAFPELAAADRRGGADVIINLANDAWLGPTRGPEQNAAHLVMRAIETRSGVIRAANTGPSLVIDPFGRIVGRSDFGVATTMTATVQTSETVPLAAKWGDWVGGLAVAVAAALGVWTALGLRLDHRTWLPWTPSTRWSDLPKQV